MPTMADLLREGRGAGDTAWTVLKGAALQPVAGYKGLFDLARGRGLEGAAQGVEDVESLAGGPSTPEGMRNLQAIGGAFEKAAEAIGNPIDKVGSMNPAAGASLAALAAVVDPTKGVGRAGRAAKKAAALVPRSKGALTEAIGAADPDIVRSMLADVKLKEGVPQATIDTAKTNRAALRAEPNVLPKPAAEMSDADWQAWGDQYGVNMTRSPDQSLGISDLTTRKEIMVPGGLEGKFSIPDLFQIKANNFDPNALPQDVHNTLMQKFLRTYDRPEGMDATDKFNALNFALLSPNAPLTQNEFLAQRLRATGPDDLARIAGMGKDEARAAEQGVGAASRGGMGVKGTADLGGQPHLARMLREHPGVFEVGEGETMKDVGRRTMNQVPGLGPKTASLGVPWLDLKNANTSAVDLHMIRNNMDRLMSDPELGGDFTGRMAALTGMPGADADALRAAAKADPRFASKLEESAIKVIGGDAVGAKYRMKGGELNPRLHPALAPEKMGFEPEQAIEFNPYYNRVVDYVDESRGPNPELALFPEQWRLWDRYRGRVEPHEMAHPDFRKLPKMSWEEMQSSLQAHKDAGYTGTQKVMKPSSWGKMYYGKATVPAMAAAGAGAAGAQALINALREEEQR